MVRSSRRSAAVLAAAFVVPALCSGCRSDAVRLDFRPKVGATYHYRITVRAVTTTTVPDGPRRRSEDDVSVLAMERVAEVAGDSDVLDVTLTPADGPARSFRVRVDRADQLIEVLSENAVPTAALGSLGLGDVLPRAAEPLPDGPVRPGQRWSVDRPVALDAQPAGRLRGTATLASLGWLHGRKVATVTSELELPASRQSTVGAATVQLAGTESTGSTVVRNLADGAVERSQSHTIGDYALTVTGVTGTVQVVIDARVDRTG